MKSDCGHICCPIRDNDYHSHTSEPDDCDLCIAAILIATEDSRPSEWDDVA